MRTLITGPGATPPEPRAALLMLHGGAEHGTDEVDRRSASLQRARWMFQSIRGPLARRGIDAALLRFSVRGWNAGRGHEPAPVGDARWALDELRAAHPDVPIVLLGHSMGARTALHVADDPAVVGVVGLAPWFPPDEDVSGLAGVHLVAAHGSRDHITSARQTRRLLQRATGVAATSEFVDMGPVGHYMLSHVRRWNRTALHHTTAIVERVHASA